MTDPAPSYTHGASGVAMIGDTIGAHFDGTVARWGDRRGLIVHQQGVDWTW
jgi:fatty-acyl-CoA synthase